MASVVAVRPESLADLEAQLRQVARSIEELRAVIEAGSGAFGAPGPEAAWSELCHTTEIAKANLAEAVEIGAQAIADGVAAFTRVDAALAGHLGGFVGR